MMKLPEGVEVRGNSIRIRFTYKEIRCGETLKGWEVTKSNIKKAGQLRAVILSEINDGSFNYIRRFPNSKKANKLSSPSSLGSEMTLQQLLDTYYEFKVKKLSSQTQYVIKGTIERCKTLLENTKVKDFNHIHALEFQKFLVEKPTIRGKARSPKTTNNHTKLLRRAFDLAVKSKFIDSNPFADVQLVRNKPSEPDPLERDEFEKLLEATPNERWANMFTVAVYTGLRTGELCALAWEDIDLEKGVINVRRNIGVKRVFTTPKTHRSTRTVHLLKPALEALRSQMKYTYSLTEKDIEVEVKNTSEVRRESVRFVFVPMNCLQKTELTYKTTTYNRLWTRRLKAAGIRHRCSYQSRHTYACWLISNNANLSFIAEQMGHVGTSMLERVYGRFMKSHASNQIDILNKVISNWPTSAPSENSIE